MKTKFLIYAKGHYLDEIILSCEKKKNFGTMLISKCVIMQKVQNSSYSILLNYPVFEISTYFDNN
ncbi:hypothetical protein BpHYR1_021371 [Brachionus plicatilis]|uniref:Uncharacterized protein n=1 Tax=Brachionus plicatilis TaxID=10195 RepID=A0A3M7Q842_BRAPC|nr:hypothetical protein BpHYR1_021371 [Brachionus plicatilis]